MVISPSQKASMLCHPMQNRPLNVKDYARIQHFPDDWIFKGTIVVNYRQIGNATSVGLARALGQTLLTVANNDTTIKTKRVRGTNVHNRKNTVEMGCNYGNK
jgi:DNA (cytosine-5)-methyltransferase 1